ncbi:MAG: acyltransferase [Candidatus Azambacteria bacterium]|nr:acyltransferase [Candidatus Azambacteria bacterium]
MPKKPKQSKKYFIHPTAVIEDDVTLGEGTKIWHLSQVRRGSKLGKNCIVGRSVFIDFESKIGDNVKIQNNAILYHETIIEDGVFIGPNVCLTNDRQPRAINPDETLKSADDWEVATTLIQKGAAIGANSVITPGITIGKWVMSGSGSVITKDIPDHALVYGNPARIKGFVCKCGKKLQKIGENNDVVVTKCSCGEEIIIPRNIYRLKEENKNKRRIWLR